MLETRVTWTNSSKYLPASSTDLAREGVFELFLDTSESFCVRARVLRSSILPVSSLFLHSTDGCYSKHTEVRRNNFWYSPVKTELVEIEVFVVQGTIFPNFQFSLIGFSTLRRCKMVTSVSTLLLIFS